MVQTLKDLEREGRACLLKGRLKIDPYLTELEDDRGGISVILHPEDHVIDRIGVFIERLKSIDPNQYYYTSEQIHATVLSIISCFSGFRLSDIDQVKYLDVIGQAVNGYEPFKIHFQGISVTPVAVILKAKGDLGPLNGLRENIRSVFNDSGLYHSMDSRYKLTGAHITLVRFKDQVLDPKKFLSVIDESDLGDFGVASIDAVDFVFNDWYHTPSRTEVLGYFDLKMPD